MGYPYLYILFGVMSLGQKNEAYYGILRQPYVIFNKNSRKLSLSSKLCNQYMGINNNYNNWVTVANFTLSSLPPELLQRGAVLNVGYGTEGESS